MAFLPISFHANLILNRLRNEKRIADDRRSHEDSGSSDNEKEEAARAELERLNKKHALLRARVEPTVFKGGVTIVG
jgi:hypothetical protein